MEINQRPNARSGANSSKAMIWGVISIFINPFLLPSILALHFSKRSSALANKKFKTFTHNENPTEAKIGRVCGIIGIILAILFFALVVLPIFFAWQDYVSQSVIPAV
jgi:hypothetical protein